MNLSSLVKESEAVQSSVFIKTVEEVINSLRGESGKTGHLKIFEHLITVKPTGEALIIGDLHGDLKSLLNILYNSAFTQKLAENKDSTLIFLGDYGDRGPHSAEVFYIILKLKLAFPEQVILLRGNHEGPEDLKASPHDLPLQFQARFKENWKTAYYEIRELFGCLYNAVLVEERYLMIHGGLSANINSVTDLARAHLTHPETELLEDLLWSDPNEIIKTVSLSSRGAGKFFGRSVTENVLNKIGVKVLIRGHEQCKNGFKLNHNGKVLTLFSRKGAPYYNAYGAYLQLPLFEKFENARQLVPWIHKF